MRTSQAVEVIGTMVGTRSELEHEARPRSSPGRARGDWHKARAAAARSTEETKEEVDLESAAQREPGARSRAYLPGQP
jgi:ribosome assembly protein YihI (activator of Der GTPase)